MSHESDTHVLAMRPCPQCEALGVVSTETGHLEVCPLCEGDKYVSHFKAAEWELRRGSDG